MMKGSLFGVLFVVFAVWIVLAQGSTARIERACEPVNWIGNIAVSITALSGANTKNQDSVQGVINQFNYGCRYSIWRLFFEKEYLQSLKDKEAAERDGQ